MGRVLKRGLEYWSCYEGQISMVRSSFNGKTEMMLKHGLQANALHQLQDGNEAKARTAGHIY